MRPRASRNAVRVEADGRLDVALTAPPVEGKANKALCAVVADALGVAKSSVEVIAGLKSRDKTLRVEGIGANEVERGLAALKPRTAESNKH